jgi:ABC-type uncharacterized transport system permease subunit
MMLKSLHLEIVKVRDVHWAIQILLVVLGILAAFFVSGWFIGLSGGNPAEAFIAMFKGAFGEPRKVYDTLMRATPLIFTGLATVIAFRAKIWSIGQEGQLYAGAMLAYTLYRIFQPMLDRPVLLVVVLLGGFLGGGLLGLLAGWMKARFNVDIIISTVLLNYIITTLLLFLLYDHKYWMGAETYYPRTDTITKDAWFPIIFEDARLHMGFLIAVGFAFVVYWTLKRTPYGYDLRAMGSNPVATMFKGINVNKLIMVTMFFSGGLAGLAGSGEVFGVHHNVNMAISAGYGYTGIIVAMVSELNPLVVIIVSILFGALINGSVVMATQTGIHTSIIFVIQAFVLLAILITRALMSYRIRRVPDAG